MGRAGGVIRAERLSDGLCTMSCWTAAEPAWELLRAGWAVARPLGNWDSRDVHYKVPPTFLLDVPIVLYIHGKPKRRTGTERRIGGFRNIDIN